MFKKIFILNLLLGFVFAVHSFAFDSEKLVKDVSTFATIMQRAASDQNYGTQPSQAVYLEDYGLVMNLSIYTGGGSSEDRMSFVSKENPELMRVMEVYLPTIRQIKEKDKVIIIINLPHVQPQKTYFVQLAGEDLVNLTKEKINSEKFKERVTIREGLVGDGETSIDIKKLEMDASIIGLTVQRMINPTSSSSGGKTSCLYLCNRGLLIFTQVYLDRKDQPFFSKGDEECARLVTVLLPTIRQLKTADQIVLVLSGTNYSGKQAIMQVSNQDLIAFQKGKLTVEKLMETVILEEGSSYAKKYTLN